MMSVIKIKTRIGKNCITIDDGQKIYQEIHKSLLKNNTINLDFKGVEVFASPFFNAAIGQLLKDIEPETLNKNLKVLSISDSGLETMKRVIENSKKYYSNSDYRKTIGALLEEFSEAS